MSYFKPGLTSSELKAAYKSLAKQYHPDLHQDRIAECTRIMQEINAEYDNYYVGIITSSYSYSQKSPDQAYQEAKHSREKILLFMTRNKYEKGQFIGVVPGWYNGYNNDRYYYSVGDNWKDFRTGFALCEISDKDMLSVSVERIHATFEMPDFKDILSMYNSMQLSNCRKFNGDLWDHHTIYHINTQFGDFVATSYTPAIQGKKNRSATTILLKVNGEMMQCTVKTSYLGPVTVLEEVNALDMFCQEYIGYTYHDFAERYDLDYIPQYANTIGNERIRDMWTDNPIFGFCLRRDIVRLYAAKSNYKMKYGTFNFDRLIEYLPQLEMSDIDEIQDYLDEINADYEENVKRMIKKGKIRIKI